MYKKKQLCRLVILLITLFYLYYVTTKCLLINVIIKNLIIIILSNLNDIKWHKISGFILLIPINDELIKIRLISFVLTCPESARNLMVKLNCTISSLKSHSYDTHIVDNQQDVLLQRVLRQIGLLIKAAVARREPFARHQNVYLYRYQVYIGSTLRAYYIIAVILGPGGRYSLDGIISMSRYPFHW